MQTHVQAAESPHPSPTKVALASFIGTTIEWYDYFLFGTAAVLIFNSQFFPTLSPTAGTLAALATFAVAFVARPLGGIVFGHFGDRLSRKSMLVWSLLAMGVSTFAIGLLPNYEAIGLAAPMLLVALRVIQGLAVGGEWGGAIVMALEHAPASRKSFYASWPQAGVPAGIVLSSGVFYIVQLMPESQLLSFGWRIPFLLSAILIFVGLAIRLRITESPEFEAMRERAPERSIPLVELLRTSKRAIVVSIFSLAGSNTLFYVASVYLLTYGTDVAGFERGDVLLAITLGAFVDVFAIPFVAVLADRYGRQRMMLIGSLITAASAFPIFWLVNLGTPAALYLALIVAMPLAHSFVYATVSGFIATLFRPEVRFTGSSVSYQVSGIVASAPAPILASLLYAHFDTYAAVAGYLLATNLLAFAVVLWAPPEHRSEETHRAEEPREETAGEVIR